MKKLSMIAGMLVLGSAAQSYGMDEHSSSSSFFDGTKLYESIKTDLGKTLSDMRRPGERLYENVTTIPSVQGVASFISNPITIAIAALTGWYFECLGKPESKENQEKMKMLEARIKELEALQVEQEVAAEQAMQEEQAA